MKIPLDPAVNKGVEVGVGTPNVESSDTDLVTKVVSALLLLFVLVCLGYCICKPFCVACKCVGKVICFPFRLMFGLCRGTCVCLEGLIFDDDEEHYRKEKKMMYG